MKLCQMNLVNELKEKRKPLIGTIVSLPSASATEALSHCGFDWLWIDMEHGALELEHIQHILMAKGDRCAGYVRIPLNEEVWIKRVLDLGADGVIVPNVKSKEEAEWVVDACKYPPLGSRSAGLARAQGYGHKDFGEYAKEANENISVLLQIEHVEGVENIDGILDVEGVSAIIIGPYDLSGSLGKLGAVQDKDVTFAINKVFNKCKRRGVPIGIFAMNAEHGKEYLKKGFDLLAIGIDVHYMWTAARASLNAVGEVMLADVQA